MENELPYIISFSEKRDNNRYGKLIAINDYEINMPIKRIFYLYDFNDNGEMLNQRGCHTHQNTTEILIMLSGTVDIETKHLVTKEERFFKLNAPTMALTLPANNYIKLKNFTKDSIMIVLCDKIFEEDIYVK